MNGVIGLLALLWPALAAAVTPPASVQQVAVDLIDSLQRGNLQAAEACLLSFEEWRALSNRALDPERHAARGKAFLGQLSAEFRAGVKTERLELKDVLVLPRDPKRRSEVTMAVFHLGLIIPGGPETVLLPLLFLQAGGHWKLMIRA